MCPGSTTSALFLMLMMEAKVITMSLQCHAKKGGAKWESTEVGFVRVWADTH